MSDEDQKSPQPGRPRVADRVVRHRSWVVAATLVVVIVLFSLIAGRARTRGRPPVVQFGVQVRPPSASGLVYTNGWLVSGGAEQVAVYAGSEASNRADGLLLIVRVSAHRHRSARVVIRGSGAVTLLRPASPATVTAALHAQLRFITAAGATGILDVGDGRTAFIH